MIVLSFDPGSSLSAWSLLESRGVAPKPITIAALQWGMIHSREADVLHVLDEGVSVAPDAIVIETIEGYAFKQTSQRGGGQAVVKGLLDTKNAESMIRTLCRNRGDVVDITARQWRKSLCDKANAKNPLIKARLQQVVYGLPRTNPHVRDSMGAGVALIWARGGRA